MSACGAMGPMCMTSELDEGDSFLDDGDRRMELARQWDDLVDEVRQLPGFGDFLRPPRVEELLPVAADGPVVYINVSRWRCDALAVLPNGIRTIPLPALTNTVVTERVQVYLDALVGLENASAAVRRARVAASADAAELEDALRYTDMKEHAWNAQQERDAVLAATMQWLWDDVAGPILEDLQLLRGTGENTPLPRLWWCPTGLLSLLPIHAAGYHEDGPRRAVLDHVVSSYTPSLRALKLAREPATYGSSVDIGRDQSARRGEMLLVSVPSVPGQPQLHGSDAEADELAGLFGDACLSLRGADATTTRVVAEMARHRWAHFSCHGDQNLTDPSSGGILLVDGVLTISRISTQTHERDFAFLAACKTATGGVHLPDEAITLAAALHYTGYRHVIGTLWSVADSTAVDVSHAVYRELVVNGVLHAERSAYALHATVTKLRHAGRPLHSWSPFTHTGP